MNLVSTAADPVPPGVRVERLIVPDGTRLRAAHWIPEGARRGTVVFLNGRTEYLEKYLEFYEHLLARGFAVATLDWRGQGLSSRPLANRQRGYVESFDRYLEDLHHFIETFVTPACPSPYALIGHSMGGHIGLRYLHDQPGRFERAAFTSPMWGLVAWRERRTWMDAFAWLACSLGLRKQTVPGFGGDNDGADSRFETNVLTGDRGRFDRMQAQLDADPQLALGAPTFGWIREALRSIAITRQAGFAEKISTPIRVFSSEGDKVVPPVAHHRFVDRLTDAAVHTVPGARHELLIESDAIRDPILAALDGFLTDGSA